MIFAKNEYIQESLIRQMHSNEFYKEYIAIANGFFDSKNGTINLPISRKENSIIERCVNSNGDTAITHYEVIYQDEINGIPFSVVKCILETGRTHQIRVHLSSIGHPILSDTLYGSSSPLIDRQALHSYKVSFKHPITNEFVYYSSNLPIDFKNIIEKRC